MKSQNVKRTLASIFAAAGLALCLAAVPAMVQGEATGASGAPNGAMQPAGNSDRAQGPASVANSGPIDPKSPEGVVNGNGMVPGSSDPSGFQAGSSMNPNEGANPNNLNRRQGDPNTEQ